MKNELKSVYKYEKRTIELATMLDALAHPARLQILLHLSRHKYCPAGNISKQLPLSKSTVSKHMSKLKETGLITCAPYRNCINYKVNDEFLLLIKDLFYDYFKQIDMYRDKRTDCTLTPLSNSQKVIEDLVKNEEEITTPHKYQ